VRTPLADGPGTSGTAAESLQRIAEVADETGLTPRAIRYYEEIGLLKPAARSDGAYRLYDVDDLARLRFIKGLREDAGFSLADIRQLLEDEAARARFRARFRATTDPAQRREILLAAIGQVDRQVESLREKMARLASMIDAAQARRDHLVEHLEALESGRELPPREGGTSRR
jgi:DNA-binding transcriptional MerR regulator